MGGLTRVVTIGKDGVAAEESLSSRQALAKLHGIAEQFLGTVHDSRRLTTDMDGVQIYDDNALTAIEIAGGKSAAEMFPLYANKNIAAVAAGAAAYCWYAPTLFGAQMLKGLPVEFNKAVGKHMRLIPGTAACIDSLLELGYELTTVTAGHQESADEVSARLGVKKTIGTRLGIADGKYDGTVKSFVGGKHKRLVVQQLLQTQAGAYAGTHIGDSWSDVETFAAIPNAVAFNPGCMYALAYARISIIGTSHKALLPLFDDHGVYDHSFLSDDGLPSLVIVRQGSIPLQAKERLLDESKRVKKCVIGDMLDKEQGNYSAVKRRIIDELREKKLPYRTHSGPFMSPEAFDAFAKKEYGQLKVEEP